MRWTAILRTTLWSVLWCFDEPYELLTLNPKLPHSPPHKCVPQAVVRAEAGLGGHFESGLGAHFELRLRLALGPGLRLAVGLELRLVPGPGTRTGAGAWSGA